MKTTVPATKPILLFGNGNLACSIAVCLLKAKYFVELYTDNIPEAVNSILAHFSDMNHENEKCPIESRLQVNNAIKSNSDCELAIVISREELALKRDIISELENKLSANTVIAVNTESISLDEIQQSANHPERIIGLNWTEPAHTTQFLEIITNRVVDEGIVSQMKEYAKTWNKDPYVVENYGVRGRLMSAMVREAFYLVENEYASIEDIDRACRNDAGYYLPFAGNCRYMDLMGTYAYGMVMKDLNPDLSKDQKLPEFFTDILNDGGLGMENGKGLYKYSPDEVEQWRNTFNEFSYQIEEIIKKYPFNNKKGTPS